MNESAFPMTSAAARILIAVGSFLCCLAPGPLEAGKTSDGPVLGRSVSFSVTYTIAASNTTELVILTTLVP